MSVRVRLTRTGRKNLPAYRIAVFDIRTRRDGPALEVVGWYNPLSREAGKGFQVKADRLQDWVNRGATVTLAVRQLLTRQGVAVPTAPKTAASPAAAKAAPAKGPAKKGAGALPKEETARRKAKKAKQASRRAWQAKKAAAAKAAAAAPAKA